MRFRFNTFLTCLASRPVPPPHCQRIPGKGRGLELPIGEHQSHRFRRHSLIVTSRFTALEMHRFAMG